MVAAKYLIATAPEEFLVSQDFEGQLTEKLVECLEHEEFRVRIAAGQVCGELCHRRGLSAFNQYLPRVIQGVTDNLERSNDSNSTEYEQSLCELDLVKVNIYLRQFRSLSVRSFSKTKKSARVEALCLFSTIQLVGRIWRRG